MQMPSNHSWSSKLLDMILPPRCIGCGVVISEHHELCSVCWKNCHFLSPPWCIKCGLPFPYEMPEQTLCFYCLNMTPLFTQCRSAMVYHDVARSIILRFKQGDCTYLAKGMAKLMLRIAQEILSNTDILIPVPLHWSRLFVRQYNQATLLSNNLSHLTNIPTRTDLIKRKRSTLKQGHQNRKDRFKNVKGAFCIPSSKLAFLKEKRLTLIDDVFTTGATLTECTRTLLNGGAKEVRIISLARVITTVQ